LSVYVGHVLKALEAIVKSPRLRDPHLIRAAPGKLLVANCNRLPVIGY
jgi:hypothetical protein